ncbi:MAG: InlB B-repeat-containing protein [Candidatus Methanoplasma sp.]|nr:InlB B-repeat-containing protein [Candidatus Methanoplasma sp.]
MAVVIFLAIDNGEDQQGSISEPLELTVSVHGSDFQWSGPAKATKGETYLTEIKSVYGSVTACYVYISDRQLSSGYTFAPSNGVLIIEGERVTGNILIVPLTETPLRVTLNGRDMPPAFEGREYSVPLSEPGRKVMSYYVTVSGILSYGAMQLDEHDQLTIPGYLVKGEISIATVTEHTDYVVDVIVDGSALFVGEPTASYGTDYVALVKPAIGYRFADDQPIKVSIGRNEPIEVRLSDSRSITIPGEDVVGNITILVSTVEAKYAVSLPAGLEGETWAYWGVDYVASPSDDGKSIDSFEVFIRGEKVFARTEGGAIVINGSVIFGDISISASISTRNYGVSLDIIGKADFHGDATVAHGSPYTATIDPHIERSGNSVSELYDIKDVKVIVGGKALDGQTSGHSARPTSSYTYDSDGTLYIPGELITGEVRILIDTERNAIRGTLDGDGTVIVFNANGGDFEDGKGKWSMFIKSGETVQIVPLPTRSNFDFVGWYTDSKTADKWDGSVKSTTGTAWVNLYAKWDSNLYRKYAPTVISDEKVFLFSMPNSDGKSVSHIYHMATLDGVLTESYFSPVMSFGDATNIEVVNKSVHTTTKENEVTKWANKTISSKNTVIVNDGKKTADTIGTYFKAASLVGMVMKRIPIPYVPAIGAFIEIVGKAGTLVTSLISLASENEESIETWTTEYSGWTSVQREFESRTDTEIFSITNNLKYSNAGDWVCYGILSTVEYLQIEIYDLNGEYLRTEYTYNTCNSRAEWLTAPTAEDYARKFVNPDKTPQERVVNDSRSAGGSGTSTDPIRIGDTETNMYRDLEVVRKYPQLHYVLERDIDLSGQKSWVPLPTLKGSLNGNGHTIIGLTISVPSGEANSHRGSDLHLGLFLGIDGTVKNLNLSKFNITLATGNDAYHMAYAGFLCASGSGNVSNVRVSASSATIHLDKSSTGGIAGAFYGTIYDSRVDDCKMFSNGDLGGMAGTLRGKASWCTMTGGEIYYFAVNTQRSTGGIAGNANGSIIEYCNVYFVRYVVDGTNSLKPCQGYIVGHLIGGTVKSVGMSGCVKDLRITLKKSGILGIGGYDYTENYFSASSWGFAGYIQGNPAIS